MRTAGKYSAIWQKVLKGMNDSMKKSAAEQANYDVSLLFSVLILVGIGIVMVYSASSTLALEKYGEDYYFLKKQILFSLLGVAALVTCRYIPYRLYRSLAYVCLGVAFALLVAIQVTTLGHSAGGAERWLRYKFFSFQPSEFARFAMVLYLAYSLSKKQDKIKALSIGFVPHNIVLSIFVVLIALQKIMAAPNVKAWHMVAAVGCGLAVSTKLNVLPVFLYLLNGLYLCIKKRPAHINRLFLDFPAVMVGHQGQRR